MDRKERVVSTIKARRTSVALSCGVLLGAMLVPGLALAQSTVPSTPPALDLVPPEDDPLTSGEEGVNTPLEESFGPKSHDDWVKESRRKALNDTKIAVQVRSYYLDRDKFDGGQSETWALGGSIGLKTGYFRERFALGATAYTAQPLYGPEDKDGAGLLQSGQEGYVALGEL